MNWIKEAKPAITIFENVRNLHSKAGDGKSNLDKLVQLMNELGYAVRAMLLDATPFGSPARRPRWYIVSLRMSNGPLQGDDCNPPVLAELQKIVEGLTIDTLSLDSFLLPEGDPLLVKKAAVEEKKWAEAEAAKALARAKRAAKVAKQPANDPAPVAQSWEQEHMEAFQQKGWTWPPNLSNVPNCPDSLGRRKQELVFMNYMQCLDGGRRIDDINMSVFFGTPGQDVVPCIVSTSVMWLTDKRQRICRELHGAELMALQGWHPSEQRGDFTHDQLKDPAGNAFCAFTLTPVLIGILATVDWKDLMNRSAETLTISDGECDDDDHDMSAETLRGKSDIEGSYDDLSDGEEGDCEDTR